MVAKLSSNQLKVNRLISEGYSIFISGKGGCGKSFLLRQMIKQLRQKNIEYFVTASTGIAAVNIGGTTIHSFAGIGTGSKGSHELISSILSNAEARQRWENCAVLIIDKVSMISSRLPMVNYNKCAISF